MGPRTAAYFSGFYKIRSHPECPHLHSSGICDWPLVLEPELDDLRHDHALLHHLGGEGGGVEHVKPVAHATILQEAEMKDRADFVPTELKSLMKDQDLKSHSGLERGAWWDLERNFGETFSLVVRPCQRVSIHFLGHQ